MGIIERASMNLELDRSIDDKVDSKNNKVSNSALIPIEE